MRPHTHTPPQPPEPAWGLPRRMARAVCICARCGSMSIWVGQCMACGERHSVTLVNCSSSNLRPPSQ